MQSTKAISGGVRNFSCNSREEAFHFTSDTSTLYNDDDDDENDTTQACLDIR